MFALLPSHCGMSFRLAGVPPTAGEHWTRVADSARVDLLLLFACRA